MEKPRVLIADDDDDMRHLMIMVLCTDYQIVGAVTNGAELLQAATCLLPDVIVADISTPRIGGPAVRNRLIGQGKFIPFVFLYQESREIINVLGSETSYAFVSKNEIPVNLVKAVEAVHKGETLDSSSYGKTFDPEPEGQNVVLIDDATLRKAEQMILSCERCNSEADIPFDQILDQLTGSDPSVTEYILKKRGTCPNCLMAITEKTLVELDNDC